MHKYGKPSGPLIEHKQAFFKENEERLQQMLALAETYAKQPPRTACKNCEHSLGKPDFVQHGVGYALCERCGHLNGLHEDTQAFCAALYTEDDGKAYGTTYMTAEREAYASRLRDIYLPKAEFLVEALREVGADPTTLRYTDMGAGSGYFVGALKMLGLAEVRGLDVSSSQIDFGNAMLDAQLLACHELEATPDLVTSLETEVVSFIGVLEHLPNPRAVLAAVAANSAIRFMYFSVPLYSVSVLLELANPDVMPRQLCGGHTHLYTESSIDHFCSEYGFTRRSEWWFGSDMVDFFRTLSVRLGRPEAGPHATELLADAFPGLIDDLQLALDKRHFCSEVHMLVENKGR